MRRRLVLPALIAACLLLVIPGTAGSRSTPPATKAVLLTSFPFACEMADEGAEVRVYCWEGSNGNARHVLLDSAGEVSLTTTEPLPTGLGGPGLPYGAWLTIGRFRCEVLRKGIECVLISSGKGFLITRTGIVDVQSAPGITEPGGQDRVGIRADQGASLILEASQRFGPCADGLYSRYDTRNRSALNRKGRRR